MKRGSNWFFLAIVGLAGLYLITALITDPAGLLRQAAIIGITIAIVYLVFRYFMKKRMGAEHSSYSKAVKQQKRPAREKTYSASPSKTVTPIKKYTKSKPLKKKSKSSSHLTVIEGKKGKKKNRALY
ncbi:SA1362 family protein [Metabacillus sp. 84]|uniref:SA1362 family protein n=1 Tax=Metabacillus sp. 84 TaxID=3404705 RepID=UPI003CEE7A9F